LTLSLSSLSSLAALAAAAAAAAAAAVSAAAAAAVARRRRGAFVVAFMVVAGTAIFSDLLKKIKRILT
jgi:hypothetical protein